MPPLILVTAFLLLHANSINCSNGQYFALTNLIHRIHNESNSPTVLFFGLEDSFLQFFMKTTTDIPAVIWDRSSKPMDSQKKFRWNAILVVQASIQNNCQALQLIIPSLRVRKFVIVSADSFEILHEWILFLSKNKFTRIFGIVGEKTYAYSQYANDRLRRLSNENPLPNPMKDLNGFRFRTTISPDLPRVFWLKDADGNREISGYVGQLFVSFLKKHNATFAEVQIEDVESRFMLAVREATFNNKIDVSMNAYKPVEGLEVSYPFCLMTWNIIAPINGHLDPTQYFVRPFSSVVWLSIGLTVFYIFVMNVLKDYLTNLPFKSVWVYFSEIYLMILNYSTETPLKRQFRFYSQVIVLAFILGNLYTVMLTSFLTVYIQIKQFNLMEDLVNMNFPVMMIDYEWEAIKDPELHPKDFEKIVALVNRDVMFRERNKMTNTSFAYAMGGDKARFYLGFQKRFAAKSLFRLMHDTLGSYYLGFLLAEYSPFTEILNEFIIEILETGLMEKWSRDVIGQVRSHGLLKIESVFPERKIPYPLTVYHLSFAWICLASGLVVATIVFVGEKIIKSVVNSGTMVK